MAILSELKLNSFRLFNKLQNIWQYDEVSISEIENEDLDFTSEVGKEKIVHQLAGLGHLGQYE